MFSNGPVGPFDAALLARLSRSMPVSSLRGAIIQFTALNCRFVVDICRLGPADAAPKYHCRAEVTTSQKPILRWEAPNFGPADCVSAFLAGGAQPGG